MSCTSAAAEASANGEMLDFMPTGARRRRRVEGISDAREGAQEET